MSVKTHIKIFRKEYGQGGEIWTFKLVGDREAYSGRNFDGGDSWVSIPISKMKNLINHSLKSITQKE